MRTMYDAVTARNIAKKDPRPAMVAGYIDRIKLAPWTAADWAMFPDARKVTIVKKASTRDGHVLDVEPGDATPEQAPGWAAQRRRDGFAYPTIYCNRSTWPKVKQAFAAQNVAPPLYWIATATGRAEIPDGAIAAQYLLDVAPGIDISVVADYWPGVDPAPTEEDDDMKLTDTVDLYGTEPDGTLNNVLAGTFANAKDTLAEVRAARVTIGQLVTLVSQQHAVDPVALAKALEPAVTAAIAAHDFGGSPEETAQAVRDMLHEITGGAQ